MLLGMNTDALELPCVSTTIKTAKAALLSSEWWLTNSIDKVTLKALLANYERGIRGTANPAARCLRIFAKEKDWQCPGQLACFVHLAPTNSSQPLALSVIYFIAFITPRASIACECACVGATALSIISNGKSLSAGAWRVEESGKDTLGWIDHQEHSSRL